MNGEIGVGIRKEDGIKNTDSTKSNSTQFKTKGEIRWFLPLFERSTIMLRLNGGLLSNKANYDNELYRIGGLKTFRGFDEESILASTYSIFSMEYRVLLEQNSNAYLFVDMGWYEYFSANSGSARDTPYGFGAGINFQTKAGIFSVNYALGSQKNNPILLKSAKLHFGIVNYF